MLKKLFSLFVILYSFILKGQVIYSDNFNENIHKTSSSNHYNSSLKNKALTIEGNGSATPYHSISYTIHKGQNNRSTNINSNPKLYIKARGTGSPKLRIDLKDNNGYLTNLNAIEINLESNYKIFTLNYTKNLEDGAYSGPCKVSPCVVDTKKIQALEFMINASTGNYNGNIEIEWLSFGESLELPLAKKHNIRYNELGYLKNRKKIISLNSKTAFSTISYTIKDASGKTLLDGITKTASFWKDAHEYVAIIDVTTINKIGSYTISTNEDEITFKVGNSVYDDLSNSAFKYFYYNRASTYIDTQYAGKWSRNAGHQDNKVIIHSSASSKNRPSGTIISAPKGWYDAGDYNKYVTNSGISTYTLLAAFEHYKNYYKTKTFNIPESNNNLPDILDEALWNLEWLLAMQDNKKQGGDGGVYHKLTSLKFSGRILPEAHKANRYVVQKTTAAALNFAAVMAVASRIFKNYNIQKPGYHKTLLIAAKEAYSWAKKNPEIYYSQPEDIKTGMYKNKTLADKFQWATSELFITTGKKKYKNDIKANTIKGEIPQWERTNPLALISLGFHSNRLKSKINTKTINTALIKTADTIKNAINASAMQISLKTKDYKWGSNGNVANQILLLIRAFEHTKEVTYLNAAYVAMDYLLGRNGLGKSFITGFGVNKALNPHHRISDADGIDEPLPGMLIGGPHTYHPDNCTYSNQYPATSYTDDWCSFSTNEVTINWNAPLVYIVNALKHYQDTETGFIKLKTD